MNTSSNKGLWLILLGFILVVFIVFGYIFYLDSQKDHFDSLYNKEMILHADFGVIPQEKTFMEKNNLLPRVNQENNYYLIINKDKTLFTYYTDWYYKIDPRKGYILVNEYNLSQKEIDEILNAIKEVEIENDFLNEVGDYVKLTYEDDRITYIPRSDLLKIIQKPDRMIDL